MGYYLGLLDFTNKNTWCPDKFEFHINKEWFFLVQLCPRYCMGHTYAKKLFLVYLKFRCNWESCILSGNPNIVDTVCWQVGISFNIFDSLIALDKGKYYLKWKNK